MKTCTSCKYNTINNRHCARCFSFSNFQPRHEEKEKTVEKNQLVVVNEIVSEMKTEKNVPMCSSLDVARRFGKRHDNVLRDIEAMGITPEVFALNFEGKIYKVRKGRGKGYISEQPYYMMTRDGFSVLVMGFTGKEAMRWKWLYVEAFNRMEAELRKQAAQQWEIPQTYADALLLAANQTKKLEETEKQLAAALPKAEFTDEVVLATGTQNLTAAAKALGLGVIRMNRFLREQRVFFKTFANYNEPYAYYIDQDYFRTKIVKAGMQGDILCSQTMVTARGIWFLYRLFQKHNWSVRTPLRRAA